MQLFSSHVFLQESQIFIDWNIFKYKETQVLSLSSSW